MDEVRRLLDDIAGQAKLYDVTERALTAGRRRRRRRAQAGPAAAALATAAAIGVAALPGGAPDGTTDRPAPPPASCSAERLPGAPGAAVLGGDPTGRYLVGRGPGGALLWDRGAVTAVPLAGSDAALVDVTAAGLAIGTSRLATGVTVSWTYHEGVVTRLAGDGAAAAAVNERGVVVGARDGRPVRWAGPGAEPEPIPPPPGWTGDWTGAAVGVDEDGTVAVHYRRQAEVALERSVLLAPGGASRELPPSGELDGHTANSVAAAAVRDGWVAGTGGVVTGYSLHLVPMRWRPGTGAAERVPLETVGAVNRLGWLAGASAGRAQLWSPAGTVTLPALAGVPGIPEPRALADDGRSAAGTQGAAPVLWRCA